MGEFIFGLFVLTILGCLATLAVTYTYKTVKEWLS